MGTSWQGLVIDTMEDSGKKNRLRETQEGIKRDIDICQPFCFGMGGETISCWVADEKGRSPGCFSASG